jgi:hypothetical protein
MEQEYLKDKAKFAQQHPQEAERIHLKFKVRALDTRALTVCVGSTRSLVTAARRPRPPCG